MVSMTLTYPKAIATSPKSLGASTLASTTVEINPIKRRAHRASMNHAAPIATMAAVPLFVFGTGSGSIIGIAN
jgi:hypothetical protein